MSTQELLALSKCGIKGLEAWNKAMEFKASMEKIQALAGTSQAQFDEISNGFLTMARQADTELSAKQQKAIRLAETTGMNFREAEQYVGWLEELQKRSGCTDDELEQQSRFCIQSAAVAGDSPVSIVCSLIACFYPERAGGL